MRIYLAGKVRNISYEAGTSWRKEATGVLHHYGIQTLDPMRDKETLEGVEAMPRSTEDMFCQPQNVFARDVFDVRQADVVLVNLNGGNGRFTMFELGMAYALGKPIILVSDDPDRDDSLPLVFAPAVIFHTLDDALEFITSMDGRA